MVRLQHARALPEREQQQWPEQEAQRAAVAHARDRPTVPGAAARAVQGSEQAEGGARARARARATRARSEKRTGRRESKRTLTTRPSSSALANCVASSPSGWASLPNLAVSGVSTAAMRTTSVRFVRPRPTCSCLRAQQLRDRRRDEPRAEVGHAVRVAVGDPLDAAPQLALLPERDPRDVVDGLERHERLSAGASASARDLNRGARARVCLNAEHRSRADERAKPRIAPRRRTRRRRSARDPSANSGLGDAWRPARARPRRGAA